MKNHRFARDYEPLTAVVDTLIIAARETLVTRWT